jgi:glycosyltransferase involved in cell wall biosynthesis
VTRVAYLTSVYPAVSHTFIEREVAAVRRAGVEVATMTVRAPADLAVLSERSRAEHATTAALLPAAGADVARLTARHAGALAATAGAAAGGRTGARARLWQAFYAAEALLLVDACRRAGTRHIHAHFANNAADIARLAVRLGRRIEPGRPWSWSFTMHGPTELFDVSRYDLAGKVAEADAVACISDFCRSQLLAHVDPAHAERLHLVRCGLEPGEYDDVADAPRAERSGVEILCVGRLVPEKGQAVLVEALDRLVARGIDARVTFVGDGPARAALEQAVAARDLSDRVTLTGALGADGVRRAYAAADVFCLPSFAEGLPVVLMEAMACGLPVVTTWIAGVPELVHDGEDGLLVPPADAERLADALGRLAEDAPERRRLGAAARRAVARRHDVDEAGRRLAKLFASMPGGDADASAP